MVTVAESMMLLDEDDSFEIFFRLRLSFDLEKKKEKQKIGEEAGYISRALLSTEYGSKGFLVQHLPTAWLRSCPPTALPARRVREILFECLNLLKVVKKEGSQKRCPL
jgi:hypothetical protein